MGASMNCQWRVHRPGGPAKPGLISGVRGGGIQGGALWCCRTLRGASRGDAHLRMREEGGGDAPAPASSLHMLRKGRFRMVWLEASSWNAAVLAFASLLQSPRSHGVRCLPLRLFSHLRRSGRSVRGSRPRLPEDVGALFPSSRRRCTRFRQLRDAVDIAPSFPEPSSRNITPQ